MKQFHDVASFRQFRQSQGQQSVGFVPTMGALHEGHKNLLRQCVAENLVSVLSIYVNPTQFNNPADLEKYPNQVQADLAIAESLGVSAVFLPHYDDLYPDDFRYLVDETSFSRELCGAHRPGHFTGVLTVVMKLLNIVQPNRAYFGEKDYQQLSLIRGMVQAFMMDVNIVAGETVREPDGLAMSSRNLNLTAPDRQLAPRLRALLASHEDDDTVASTLEAEGFEVDYIRTLDGRRFGAATLGSVRLIDNVRLAK